MAILFPIAIWLEITDEMPSTIIDFLDYVFWFVALTGVFGYCYNKRIITKQFWQIYLPVIVVWDIFVASYEAASEPDLQDPIILSVFIPIYLALILPEYFGLYLYGYKNDSH